MTSVVSFVLAVLAMLLSPLHYLVASGGQPSEQASTSPVIERTLRWTGSSNTRVFELSNISGSVHIVGENRSDVAVTARRTVRHQGRSDDPGPAVDFRESADRLLVCGDSRHCGCHISSRRDGRNDRWDDQTRVNVDFEVRVPMNATLDVCTVNGGTLRVERVNAPFSLHNVNGGIELDRMGGSGNVVTVNGDVTATFTSAPNADSAFRTVNGDITVTMPPSLAADVRMHTMHGGMYTNFETTLLPVSATTERRGRRTIIKNNNSRMRVGAGGPELTFNTLNGDIELKKP